MKNVKKGHLHKKNTQTESFLTKKLRKKISTSTFVNDFLAIKKSQIQRSLLSMELLGIHVCRYSTSVTIRYSKSQKQPSCSVLRKGCSENMLQIYRRAPMPKRDFNKVASSFIEMAFQHGCSPINLLHIFRTPFPQKTSGWLLLKSPKNKISFKQRQNICAGIMYQINHKQMGE